MFFFWLLLSKIHEIKWINCTRLQQCTEQLMGSFSEPFFLKGVDLMGIYSG